MSEAISERNATASRHILVIEDSPSDLRLLEEAFSEADNDAALQTTTTGEDAIDVLHRLKSEGSAALPQLVISDLNLPGRDGEAVVEAIKNDLELPNLPVIVLTRSADSEDVGRCYEARANAFITKPADFADLVSLVESIGTFWCDREAANTAGASKVDHSIEDD